MTSIMTSINQSINRWRWIVQLYNRDHFTKVLTTLWSLEPRNVFRWRWNESTDDAETTLSGCAVCVQDLSGNRKCSATDGWHCQLTDSTAWDGNFQWITMGMGIRIRLGFPHFFPWEWDGSGALNPIPTTALSEVGLWATYPKSCQMVYTGLGLPFPSLLKSIVACHCSFVWCQSKGPMTSEYFPAHFEAAALCASSQVRWGRTAHRSMLLLLLLLLLLQLLQSGAIATRDDTVGTEMVAVVCKSTPSTIFCSPLSVSLRFVEIAFVLSCCTPPIGRRRRFLISTHLTGKQAQFKQLFIQPRNCVSANWRHTTGLVIYSRFRQSLKTFLFGQCVQSACSGNIPFNFALEVLILSHFYLLTEHACCYRWVYRCCISHVVSDQFTDTGSWVLYRLKVTFCWYFSVYYHCYITFTFIHQQW